MPRRAPNRPPRSPLAALATLSLAGCCGAVDARFPADHAPVQGATSVEGGCEAQRAMVRAAVSDTAALWRDQGFWSLVNGYAWLSDAHVTQRRCSDRKMAYSGKDIVDALRKIEPASRRYVITCVNAACFFGMQGKTTADTAACGVTRIDRHRTRSWDFLHNTLAHENTHAIGYDDRTVGCAAADWKFTDGDYERVPEAIPWLVSYGIGDLAQCYRLHQTEARVRADSVRQCFDHIYDGDPGAWAAPDGRRRRQCCACLNPAREYECARRAILELRKQAACEATQCPPCPP